MYDSSQKTKGKRLNHVPPTRDYQYLLSDNHRVTFQQTFSQYLSTSKFCPEISKGRQIDFNNVFTLKLNLSFYAHKSGNNPKYILVQ